jgi:dihydrofolate reductase
MELRMVVAVSENGIIGKDGSVPWNVPEDVKHWKSTVRGHPIIVGRGTFDGMKPLDGCFHAVLTTDPSRTSDHDRVTYVTSPAEAVDVAAEHDDLIYVIGGGGVYRTFLPATHRIILSRIPGTYEGDVTFPELDDRWTVEDRDERETFTIVTYRNEDPVPVTDLGE